MNARLLALVAVCALGMTPPAGAATQPANAPPAADRPLEPREAEALAAVGLVASTSPVVGYLPDAACARCHARIAREYQTVGMSRSFAKPGEVRWVEDFDAQPYHHQASDRYYQYTRNGDDLVLRRWQKDLDGREILPLELRVDWILGSGSVSRTYLYATPSGEWFQLPLAWYTQEQAWAMAPGFDKPRHLGANRLVRRECTFCHNAYPLDGPPIVARHQPHRMGQDPPRGIGCQRCHGPGARHVAQVELGRSPDEVSAAIVNPADLQPTLARDVCLQCHFQSTPSIQRVRRFGRSDYDFRPGQALVDFMTLLDIEVASAPGEGREGRFEINHHGYRLEQSACFTREESLMLCTQCHDPHRKAAGAGMASRVRSTCLECHGRQGSTVTEGATPNPSRARAAGTHIAPEHLEFEECSSCHMPRRRAQDVVHAVMTDHRIQRPVGEPAFLLRPLAESEDEVLDVLLLRPTVDPATDALYRAVAGVRAGSDASLLKLEELVGALEHRPLEVLHDIARLRASTARDAGPALTLALQQAPADPTLLGLLGVQQAAAGDVAAARSTLLRAAGLDPRRAEHWMNLGRLDLGAGDLARARRRLERAVSLRPNLAPAWHWLAQTQRLAGQLEEAASSALQALTLDPSSPNLVHHLVTLLRELGRHEEAQRYLEHGLAASPAHPELQKLADAAPAPR